MDALGMKPKDFAERTFGIKAKQAGFSGRGATHFAERTFGIKAKPVFPRGQAAAQFCRKNNWNQGKAS